MGWCEKRSFQARRGVSLVSPHNWENFWCTLRYDCGQSTKCWGDCQEAFSALKLCRINLIGESCLLAGSLRALALWISQNTNFFIAYRWCTHESVENYVQLMHHMYIPYNPSHNIKSQEGCEVGEMCVLAVWFQGGEKKHLTKTQTYHTHLFVVASVYNNVLLQNFRPLRLLKPCPQPVQLPRPPAFEHLFKRHFFASR